MKITLIGFVAVLIATSIGCSRVSPGPGEEAVLIYKPMFFGHGGIDLEPVKTGSAWIALTTDDKLVNMLPFRVDEPFEDLMSKDNVPMSFHAVARMQIVNSVLLISKFGEDWYKANVQRQFQNFVRNNAKNYSMTELAISQQSVFDMEAKVGEELVAYLKAQGIPVILKEVTVGRVAPPQNVVEQQKQTAEQQQRIKTEAGKKLAEDSRLAAEESRAAADKAYQEKMGLSGGQFVQLETMKMCVTAGKNCQVFIGSTPVPVVGK